ncbi:MAG: hypothetical protein LBI86_09645 [Treponema sp.]|jgi:hypothetical protein|nr:hypothetical protein [Treponema sp.]
MFIIINTLVLIIVCASFFELICLKYYFGFPVFDEQFGSIIENVCYSLIASCIFYIFIEMIPSLRKRNYYEKILNPQKTKLNTAYISLIQYLIGTNILEKSAKIDDYKIEFNYLIKKLNRNNNWNTNINDLIKRSENLKNEINNILKYSEYVDSKIVKIFNDVNYQIDLINLNNYTSIDEDGIVDFIQTIIEIYQQIINRYEIIYKFSGKNGIYKDFKLSE